MSRGDRLVLAAVKIGLPPPGVSVADLPDPNSTGAQLLVGYCMQCHALPSPVMHSATDWPAVVRRMWLRMDYLPDSFNIRKPTASQRYELLSYLTIDALRVSGAVLPQGKGRESFELTCSRCHSLPDPRSHSTTDWDVVVARMIQNMERMGVRVPSQDEENDLLLYLHSVRPLPPPVQVH
jgi:cytochrome c5